ncbi:MAG: hypothetical protein P8P27_03560 [Flavobacteriaceae bacterium]|nr:hypothetical protein [Flavobacteriaceae bacterium]|tara:strand:+ start:33760 stop:33945 length:186 start_codon:yes stop_codon:yes gene_type:complete
MINSKKKSIIMNEEKLINKKIIQFYNTDGVKKVFDIHRYSDKGILYFLRKSEVADDFVITG